MVVRPAVVAGDATELDVGELGDVVLGRLCDELDAVELAPLLPDLAIPSHGAGAHGAALHLAEVTLAGNPRAHPGVLEDDPADGAGDVEGLQVLHSVDDAAGGDVEELAAG